MKTAMMISILAAASVAMAGEFHVTGGKVNLQGTISADQITFDTGSVIQGSGTLNGNVSLGGDIMPNQTLSISGNALFTSGGRLIGEIFAPGDLDQLICSNASGVCEVDYTATETIPIIRESVLVAETGNYVGFTPSETDIWQLSSQSGNLLITHLLMDVDSDGMPDWWEEDMLGNHTGPLANADSDGDGISNLDEFIALTDPMDMASLFKASLTSSSSQQLSFKTALDRLYSIEVTDDLTSGWSLWTNNIPGTGSDLELIVSNAASNQFYRILVELEP